MRMLRLTVGALVALAAMLIFAAGPAHADPAVRVDNPAEGATWDGAETTDFHVTGLAQTDSGGYIVKVGVVANSSDGAGHQYQAEQTYPDQNQSQGFDVTLVPGSNGKYQLTITNYAHNCSILGCSDPEASATRNITVAQPPISPRDVKATLKDSVVTISWSANPEEDMLGYLIERSRNGGSYTCLSDVDHTGAPSYKGTDDLKDNDPGDYRYRVVAVRARDKDSNKPTCKAIGTGLKSVPSVAGPIPWGTSTTTTTPGGPGATTTTTTKPVDGLTRLSGAGASSSSGKTSKKPNLSALSGLAPVNNLAGRPKAPNEPDTGFNELLPFQRGDGGDQSDIGGLPSTSLPASDSGSGHTTTLLFVAAGLLVTVLSAHVLWLKAQVDRMPLEALTPEELPLA